MSIECPCAQCQAHRERRTAAVVSSYSLAQQVMELKLQLAGKTTALQIAENENTLLRMSAQISASTRSLSQLAAAVLAKPKTTALTFGEALIEMRAVKKLRRSGWNGPGQYVYYVPAAKYKAQTAVAKAEFGHEVPYNAYFALKNAQGVVSVWTPSTSDAMADDWMVVP